MTIGSHQTTVGKSQSHLTPRHIIDALRPFDLDPCASDPRPFDCATTNWTEGGLDRDWSAFGSVWLNPPFDRYQVGQWIERLSHHPAGGIALLHARTETGWFEPIWERADAILFLADRLKFLRPDGTEQPANSGAPVVLCAFGGWAMQRLRTANLSGRIVTAWERAA